MRRRILIVALALGTVLGYGAFFFRLAHHARGGGYGHHGYGWSGHRRAAFERHVADLCTDAALRARPQNLAPPAAAARP